MNPRYQSIFTTFSSLMLIGSALLPAVAVAQDAGAENVQVLTRGPVHEAFAESVSYDPQPGLIISTKVPELIEELPPEQRPEGNNVTWISGYWAWDEDQNDFIWISGIWRNLPPGRQWVAGYWNDVSDGQYQWTSGYWADSSNEEVSYVATAPPRTVEAGPNVEAPSSNHTWVPGNWFWAESRYAWRPGYWMAQRADWTWVPSRYCWTRRGYVYVDGYWDYAVAGRGVLFAPVHFRERVYTAPDYYYTPLIVVALNVFSDHLFVRPRYNHYYFGDYYAPRYQTGGYYASYSWSADRRGYDPIYAYNRWEHRDDRNWERGRQENFTYFRDHEDARPPRTWAAMRDYRDDRYSDGRNRVYATSLASIAQDPQRSKNFRSLDQGGRQEFVSQNREMRKFTQERKQWESRQTASGDDSKQMMATRERSGRSPIAGRGADKFTEKEAPPARPEGRGNKSDVRAAGRDARAPNSGTPEEMQRNGNRQDPNGAQRGKRGAVNEIDPATGKSRSERVRDGQPQQDGTRGQKQSEDQRGKRGSNEMPPADPAPGKARNDRMTDGQPQQDGTRRDPRDPQASPRGKDRDRTNNTPADSTAPTRRDPQAPGREDRSKPQSQPTADRKADSPGKADRQTPPEPNQRKQQQAPQREERAKPQGQPDRKSPTEPKPDRQPQQTAPDTNPRKQQQAPQREERSKPQPQPQQAAPERKQQQAPQRQKRSEPQAQPAPERKAQPKPERQAQPAAPPSAPRKQQQAPQREERAKPQAQQPAPERKAPSKPERQAQAAPQQAAPQQAAPQQAAPQPKKRDATRGDPDEEKGKGKNR